MRERGEPQDREVLKQLYAEARMERFKSFIARFRLKPIKRIKKKLRKVQKTTSHILKEFKKNKAKIIYFAKEDRYKNYRQYIAICRKYTEFVIKNDNVDITGRGFNDIHIDHIIPVYHAYKMGLSPYLIAMSANLQRMHKMDNQSKGMYQKLLTS